MKKMDLERGWKNGVLSYVTTTPKRGGKKDIKGLRIALRRGVVSSKKGQEKS